MIAGDILAGERIKKISKFRRNIGFCIELWVGAKHSLERFGKLTSRYFPILSAYRVEAAGLGKVNHRDLSKHN